MFNHIRRVSINQPAVNKVGEIEIKVVDICKLKKGFARLDKNEFLYNRCCVFSVDDVSSTSG